MLVKLRTRTLLLLLLLKTLFCLVLAEVREGYGLATIVGHVVAFGLVPVMAVVVYRFAVKNESVRAMWASLALAFEALRQQDKSVYWPLLAVVGGALLLVVVLSVLLALRERPVYLLNFDVYQPPDEVSIRHSFDY
jgi:hypothetical protein